MEIVSIFFFKNQKIRGVNFMFHAKIRNAKYEMAKITKFHEIRNAKHETNPSPDEQSR